MRKDPNDIRHGLTDEELAVVRRWIDAERPADRTWYVALNELHQYLETPPFDDGDKVAIQGFVADDFERTFRGVAADGQFIIERQHATGQSRVDLFEASTVKPA